MPGSNSATDGLPPFADAGGPSRRQFLAAPLVAGGLAMGGIASAAAAVAPAADDEAGWRTVAAQYDLPEGIIQLENGNWGAMARPVLAAYQQKLAMVNRETSFYSRRRFLPDMLAIRARVAADLGVRPDEIAFTRGATEALHALIGGYNRLRPGDQLLYADLDYDSMQTAFRAVARRRGLEALAITLPEPATWQGLVDTYEQALAAHPRVRLMLLTHVSHRTGLVLPVREIVAMARARDVDVIVDSAHAWGQLDFRLGDLGADFVGLTAQKWIGAPLGVGVLHIRHSRLDAIDRSLGDDPDGADAIHQRVHTGTTDMAALLTLADALDFHQNIGVKAKEARLRHLTARWTDRVRGAPGVELLVAEDPRLRSALGSFRLAGRTSLADNRALARRLLDDFGIFTVERAGPSRGACVRATPGVFSAAADVDRLADAIVAIARAAGPGIRP